jgi:hypothetical protein
VSKNASIRHIAKPVPPITVTPHSKATFEPSFCVIVICSQCKTE